MVLAVLTGLVPVALAVAAVQLLLKLWSAWLVLELAVGSPLPAGAAAAVVPGSRPRTPAC